MWDLNRCATGRRSDSELRRRRANVPFARLDGDLDRVHRTFGPAAVDDLHAVLQARRIVARQSHRRLVVEFTLRSVASEQSRSAARNARRVSVRDAVVHQSCLSSVVVARRLSLRATAGSRHPSDEYAIESARDATIVQHSGSVPVHLVVVRTLIAR